MIKNYFKTAIRNLLRYKGFAMINIASLTIGIVGCMVIGLFVWDEWQYDKSIKGGENIYRLYDENKNNNNTSYGAPVPPAYTTFLQQHYPEVDATTRILMNADKFLVEAGEKRNYEEKGWFVDSTFAQFFSLKFSKGDPATALASPHSVVISEDIAKRYFGNEDPNEKTIRKDNDTFAVKGVLAKLHTH